MIFKKILNIFSKNRYLNEIYNLKIYYLIYKKALIYNFNINYQDKAATVSNNINHEYKKPNNQIEILINIRTTIK